MVPGRAARDTGAMRKRTWILAVAAVAVVVGLALFQPWRIFTRSSVDEALPTVMQTSAARPTATGTETLPPATPSTEAGPRTLSRGEFVDGEHATSGTARIIELADGSRYLRLEGFSTSDGPDVHVWLTDQPSGGDWGSYDDGRFIALGSLKATDGNQNYALPAGTSLEGIQSAVIWCDRFNVAFGTAALA